MQSKIKTNELRIRNYIQTRERNLVADALSRNPVIEEGQADPDQPTVKLFDMADNDAFNNTSESDSDNFIRSFKVAMAKRKLKSKKKVKFTQESKSDSDYIVPKKAKIMKRKKTVVTRSKRFSKMS